MKISLLVYKLLNKCSVSESGCVSKVMVLRMKFIGIKIGWLKGCIVSFFVKLLMFFILIE